MARSWHFLTQFMSSYSLWFFEAIYWILLLKNRWFIFFTVLLNAFQSFNCLEALYFLSFDWHLLFHHSLDYFVILTYLECLYWILSALFVTSWTIILSVFLLLIYSVSRFLIASLNSVVNLSSSILFLIMVCYLVRMNSSLMEILTVNRV